MIPKQQYQNVRVIIGDDSLETHNKNHATGLNKCRWTQILYSLFGAKHSISVWVVIVQFSALWQNGNLANVDNPRRTSSIFCNSILCSHYTVATAYCPYCMHNSADQSHQQPDTTILMNWNIEFRAFDWFFKTWITIGMDVGKEMSWPFLIC